jgi:hypothetical protein
MRTIKEIKRKCNVYPHDDNPDKFHWVWKGARAKNGNTPVVSAPDYTKDPEGETMSVQSVIRAIYHLKTEQPIPDGVGVFRTCTVDGCVSPDCSRAMTRRQWGRFVEKTGREAGQVKWTLSNRRTWDKRKRKISATAVRKILVSTEDPQELARRYKCSISSIRKIQTGSSARLHSNARAGLFTGLMR